MNDSIGVLIVDDNKSFVERMITLLEEVSNIQKIWVATNFDQAVNILMFAQLHVVLLDINLPGKNGIELLKKIKKINNKCRVIMITNHSDKYYHHLCKDLGADHFLDKTNDFAEVPNILSRIKS